MSLRPYQQRAVDASINWMRHSISPFLIEAATGAGKSHIIAAVAEAIHNKTGKRVLCLAPSAELVTQNRAKYLTSGNPCSLFSASAGAKELRHPVVFGSPLTVKNRISRFCQTGAQGYALVVIDECHGITPTVQAIIAEMQGANPNLRVMGLSATPYRLGDGYIYAMDQDGRPMPEARDPYFTACVDAIRAPELIEQGFLTPPVIGDINVERYETSGLETNARGQFDAEAVDRAYHGHGRKTSAIVGDIVAQSQDRNGVLLFAATVQHAEEVMASLPPHLSAMVTAKTPKAERAAMLKRFLARDLKYLVNVAVLTTGFDAPHVDVVAILRKTESVGLLQQIIGRGMRLHPGKADCLILDYTSNIEDHCPDGDLFRPVVKSKETSGGGKSFKAECERCEAENLVTMRPEYLTNEGEISVPVDDAGYVLDLDGNRVETEHGPMPAHFGRRCFGMVRSGKMGEYVRCGYRWTSKECPHCEAKNDIAARYCIECKGEIVDPNEKLKGEFRAMKRDPSQKQTDQILDMVTREGVSARGNKTLRVDFTTPYRSFSIWLLPEATHSKAMSDWWTFQSATDEGNVIPETVTYQKGSDGFYKVFAYNRPKDVDPTLEDLPHAAE